MLASGIVLGAAAGIVTGGRLRHLAQLTIRWWPLLVAALVMRLVAPLEPAVSLPLLTVSLATIVVVAAINWRLPGMAVAALGAVLNLAVVVLNGGMPVDPAATRLGVAGVPMDGIHVVLASNSRLGVLGDVLAVPPFGTFSLGDLLLVAGTFWTTFTATRPR